MQKMNKGLVLLLVMITLGGCGPQVPGSIVGALTHEDDGSDHGGSEDESGLSQSESTVTTYYYENNETTGKLEIMRKKDFKGSSYGRRTPNILFPEKFEMTVLKENK